MRILVVGGGGREHALVWKLARSPKVDEIYCAPGNGGIADLAQCVDIAASDVDRMVEFAVENGVDFCVVAPDDPLALGMVDEMQKRGIPAFGPDKAAAEIESSKVFAKELMRKYGIPTADYGVFSQEEPDEALAYAIGIGFPVVVKADGLALGKGVMICENESQARDAIWDMTQNKRFGKAGERIVIEEFLSGPEVSILCFTDGDTMLPMISAQDHKRALDNDGGLNTGGMGAFAPSPKYTPEIADFVERKIMRPTIYAMAREGRRFKGVLYFGVMLTKSGPKVLEYNARFGDPETQAVLPLLRNDLMEIFEAVEQERLHEITLEWENDFAVCVVMASGGYPENYQTGYPIRGMEDAEALEKVLVFHAGTRKKGDAVVTAGGRVLGVVGLGNSLEEAMRCGYEGIGRIHFQDAHYRTDIGKK
ncbi:MAG: phosphoribosylamine--glycine ligase [Christensenellales bacterium]